MATWDGLGQITRKVQSGIYSSIAVQSGIQSCIPQEKRWNDVMAGREQKRELILGGWSHLKEKEPV